jgi:exopolysaccharide production protein ExoQ
MNPSLALLICAIGIAGLFFLDRDKSMRTSTALWLPVLWLGIVGSRSASAWLGISPPMTDPSQLLEGSPFDRLVYEILLGLGVLVLFHRGRRLAPFLKGSWAVILYFAYCLVSVLWSDFADVSFRRWIKAIGDLVMVLIVVTDAQPLEAFKRLISRLGFLLLPTSVLLIKYFGDLGRGYDPGGAPMNTGVTTNKNTLGVITMVITLGVVWNLLRLLRAKDLENRGRHLLAQATLLTFGIAVLFLAHSATSLACFTLGAGLLFATSLPSMGRRPGRIHALVGTVFIAGGLATLLGGDARVVHALGRQTDFTGRTEIWKAVMFAVSNPLLGTGFESFWLGPRLNVVWSHLSEYMHVNEAHNGYLEVYLNLGIIGVGLIALIFVKAYRDAVAVFRQDLPAGSLWLAYIFAAAFYSITEAGFRSLAPMWIFLLLAAAAAGGTARSITRVQPEPVTLKRTVPTTRLRYAARMQR